MARYVDFSVLNGLVLKQVSDLGDDLEFVTEDNRIFRMYHQQDCCESVTLDEIHGSLSDLTGLVVLAEEVSNIDPPPESRNGYGSDSCTWTFYRIGTVNGFVTLRWYGESNGYYSESVQFVETTK